MTKSIILALLLFGACSAQTISGGSVSGGSLSSVGPAPATARPNSFTSSYAASGSLNSFNVTVNTGSGSNYGCNVFIMMRGGSTSGTPTCDGHNMSHVGSPQSMASCQVAVTSDEWIYYGALTVGTITVTTETTGGTDQNTAVIIVDGTKQTGQPDAQAGVTTGTQMVGMTDYLAPMNGTIGTNGSLILGQFCMNGSTTAHDATSPNGTWLGSDAVGFGFRYWYSTANQPAGAFALDDQSPLIGAGTYQANGLSILTQ